MQRRRLLQLGLTGAAGLAVAALGVAIVEPVHVEGRLTPAAREMFAGVAAAVLDGSLPMEPGMHAAAIFALLHRLDNTIAGLPSATRAELSQLTALLANPVARWGLAGLSKSWTQASTADVLHALDGLRYSSLSAKQQAYHALRDLTNAAFYADETAWPLMAYPGPRDV